MPLPAFGPSPGSPLQGTHPPAQPAPSGCSWHSPQFEALVSFVNDQNWNRILKGLLSRVHGSNEIYREANQDL